MAYPNQILPEPAAGAVHVNVSLVLNDGELWVTDPYTVMHAEKARIIKRSCNLYTNKCLVIGNGCIIIVHRVLYILSTTFSDNNWLIPPRKANTILA